jgi:hypothetical protein
LAKLLGKIRIGSRYCKRHDKPQTPCERLLQSPLINEGQKEALRHRRDRLAPSLLKRRIEQKLAKILEIVAVDMGAAACPRSLEFGPLLDESAVFVSIRCQRGLFSLPIYLGYELDVLTMGYPTKVQLIRRQKGGDQYYINFPTAIAEAMEFDKGEGG